jgi:hypothetical protein
MWKWFANPGQIIQIVIQFAALCLGVHVAFPNVFPKGVDGFSLVWPILVLPLAAGILWLLLQRLYFPMLDGVAHREFAKRFPEFRDADSDKTKSPTIN